MTVIHPLACSASHADSAPTLSVLTPVFRWDARPILEALNAAPPAVRARIEWIALDDGSGDPGLLETLSNAVAASPAPALALTTGSNQGRAATRNRLINAARGRSVLFLDADMVPDGGAFFARWLDLIDAEAPSAAFGGFAMPARAPAATALHRFLSARSDCKPASQRQRDPAQFAATSNLLVRRDVLAATPFDDGFVGWGWEDVDFALRASRFGPLRHIDNPAVHAGLDTPETLLRKFAEAGPNYARLARKHPEAVTRFASWRVAQALKRVPLHRAARPALAWLARDPLGLTPMLARHSALKLYRASVYAEHAP